jgi:hypothetical protein
VNREQSVTFKKTAAILMGQFAHNLAARGSKNKSDD